MAKAKQRVKVQVTATIPGTEGKSPQDVPAQEIAKDISEAVRDGVLEARTFKSGNIGLYAQFELFVEVK